jgi:hypothetical protein
VGRILLESLRAISTNVYYVVKLRSCSINFGPPPDLAIARSNRAAKSSASET